MNWEDNWISVGDELQQGGQATVMKVKNKKEPSIIGALKIMHADQYKNTQRKERLIREIKAIQKINGNGVPKILDFFNGNDTIQTYFISEWVEGKDLEKYISKETLTIKQAITLTRQLALIVDNFHQLESEIVHRDLKPSNIIISEEFDLPIIVDFGISYIKDDDSVSNKTSLGEELGNRFLRLPEFTAGSQNKHDKISDVTFLVGILFFLVTRKHPRQLRDETNKAPHQRLDDKLILKLSQDSLWNSITKCFDIGFQQHKDLRFESCIAFVHYLDKIINPIKYSANNMEESLNNIKDDLKATILNEANIEKIKIRDKFENINTEVLKYIGKEIEPIGLYVASNNNELPNLHQINIFLSSRYKQPQHQIIVKHLIKIENNKVIATFILESSIKQVHTQINESNYFEGYVSDIDSLRQAVSNKLPSMLTMSLEEYQKIII